VLLTKLDKMDELLKKAIEITIENGSGSTSLLQLKLLLGYNRAGRLMDEMERLGVVGKMDGSKPRELLVKSIDDVKWVQS
jgi:S-DNA-T family DNA segregation ATPase FtsK/SpoIIIE